MKSTLEVGSHELLVESEQFEANITVLENGNPVTISLISKEQLQALANSLHQVAETMLSSSC